MTGPLVVVGDTLLDLDVDGDVHRICPDAPAPVLDERSRTGRPGGAGLAALLAAADGHEVALVTALGDDAAGARVRELLTAAGVRVFALPTAGATAEKIRLRGRGQVLLRLDRGGAETVPTGEVPDAVRTVLRAASAVLVSDYGRGLTRHAGLRSALATTSAPVVWDPHPRGAAPTPNTRLVTPNESEVRAFTGTDGASLGAVTRAGQRLRERWRAGAVVVTRGAEGAVLCHAGPTPLVVPATPAQGDTCGAGDRFAAAAAHALAGGALVSEAVQEAVARAAEYVAAGGAGTALRLLAPPGGGPTTEARTDTAVPDTAVPAATDIAATDIAATGDAVGADTGVGPEAAIGADAAGRVLAAVRSRGGTVVATGGCFDLLHAGHVATLRAARRLGDCLVVCLNSDTSVRALKGPDRPVNTERDRAELLAALDCVDAVVVFDEPTPEAVLSRLRPDVWVKGGDYADGGPGLPEADLVARWGGQTVVVPYLAGRSTTSILAAARAGARQPEGAA